MPTKKKTAKKKAKPVETISRLIFSNVKFLDYEVIDIEKDKRITNVIIADVLLGTVKRWRNGKDHNKGTEFIEGITIEIRKKATTKGKANENKAKTQQSTSKARRRIARLNSRINREAKSQA